MYKYGCSSRSRGHHFRFWMFPLVIGFVVLTNGGVWLTIPYLILIILGAYLLKNGIFSSSYSSSIPPRNQNMPLTYRKDPDHLKPENFSRKNNYCFECGAKVDFNRYCSVCGTDLTQ